MDAATLVPNRPPGRPRSSEADEAILEAAVDVLTEVGLGELTMERVAARAGVGKNTLYRRYANKYELVVSAVRRYAEVGGAPSDTGTTAGDLRALLDDLVRMLTETPLGRMLPILLAARARIPELDRAFEEIVHEEPARSVTVVRRAIARGDLRADVDVDVVADGILSPVFYRFLVTHEPVDAEFREALVEMVMRGFAPESTRG
jgi:AcrR family transcriptional regulator